MFKGHHKFTTGKWNPQRSGPQFATANDTCVRGWDLRVGNKQVWAIEGAHMQLVRYEINIYAHKNKVALFLYIVCNNFFNIKKNI